MDALILFSHGSVLCGAGETLKWHAERLRNAGDYAIVEVGYMNYSRPPFKEAVEKCVEDGATRIVVTPYFLVPGKFVRVDLPAHIKAVRELWPNIEFVIASPIGFDEKLADAILELAQSARGPEHWREDYLRASDFCEANPQCPLFASPRCPRVPAPVLQESIA
jgi:sirohydrochlorin ferrochelatase